MYSLKQIAFAPAEAVFELIASPRSGRVNLRMSKLANPGNVEITVPEPSQVSQGIGRDFGSHVIRVET